MINDIKIFLLVLSIVYILRFVKEFFYQLTRKIPESIKIKDNERTFLYFAITYIITYILIY
jgi:hypothetical protein